MTSFSPLTCTLLAFPAPPVLRWRARRLNALRGVNGSILAVQQADALLPGRAPSPLYFAALVDARRHPHPQFCSYLPPTYPHLPSPPHAALLFWQPCMAAALLTHATLWRVVANATGPAFRRYPTLRVACGRRKRVPRHYTARILDILRCRVVPLHCLRR